MMTVNELFFKDHWLPFKDVTVGTKTTLSKEIVAREHEESSSSPWRTIEHRYWMRVILTSKFGPNANFSELEKFLQPNENWEDNIASLSMLFPNRIWDGDIDSLSTTILTGVNPALSFTIHSCLVPTSRSTTHAFCEIAIPGHPFDTGCLFAISIAKEVVDKFGTVILKS
ncbi:hypothetical protein L6452_15080 [Arctium lappa]|uniref:Uncharacterized protein n=1 Tax=Arctium lappa TaxID=4217 RepID=A0ACB9CMS1_ARCLA|nr:hypothetical protein L6452_15080 [Arctium lappa]